jgi:predicted Na+-dependent transporter
VFLAATQEVEILPIVLPFVVIIVVMIIAGIILGRWWYKKRKENKETQDKIQRVTNLLS